jgi:hypothetical protein
MRHTVKRRILSDEEITAILKYNNECQSNRVIDIYHALSELFGLYEAEKEFIYGSNSLTENERNRSKLELRTCMVTGSIENNNDNLICPECGCKYIVHYTFFHPNVSEIREYEGARNYPEKQLQYYRNRTINHELSASSCKLDEEYYYCLGCGNKFGNFKLQE